MAGDELLQARFVMDQVQQGLFEGHVLPDGFHVVPRGAAVAGISNAVVGKAVAFVPGSELFLAGEDDTAFAACLHGGEVVLQQFAGDALATVFGQDDEAEDGGVGAIGLVQGGVVVVGVGQVGNVGDAAVNKADRFAVCFGDEELFGEDVQAGADAFEAGRLGGRESGGFDGGEGRGFVSAGGADGDVCHGCSLLVFVSGKRVGWGNSVYSHPHKALYSIAPLRRTNSVFGGVPCTELCEYHYTYYTYRIARLVYVNGKVAASTSRYAS